MSSIFADQMFREALGQPGATVTLAFTDASAKLGGGSPTTLAIGQVYELIATENCHIYMHAASVSAVATTAHRPIPAWTRTYLTVNSALYLAAIRNTTSGTLYLTPMTQANYRA